MKDKGKYIVSVVLAYLVLAGFYISNNTYEVLGDLHAKLGGGINGWLYKLQCGFQQMGYEACILLLFVTLFFIKFLPTLEKKLFKWSIPFSVVAGAFLLLCEAYYADYSWERVFGNLTAILLSILRGAGIAVLFFVLFHLVSRVTLILEEDNFSVNRRKTFFITAGLVFLAWIPYLIIMFPGIISPDAGDEIAQLLGRKDYCWTENTVILENPDFLLNNSHPVFYTLVLGAVVLFGRIIGSYNWAMELYCVAQSALFAMAIAYFLTYMRELGISKKVYTGCMFFFAFNPLFAMWSVTVVKDTSFAFLMLLVVVGLLKVIRDKTEKINKNCVFLMISLLLFMLTRNNGIYLLVLLMLCALPVFWKQKKQLKKMLLVLAIPALIFQVGIQGILFPAFGIAKGSKREMLAIPAQQLARTIKEHNDFSEEEEAIIMAVFDGKGDKTVEQFVARYEPDFGDPTKNCYDRYTTTKEMLSMLGVWIKGFFRHPGTYVEAFLNVNYGWFSLDNHRDGRFYNGAISEGIAAMLPGTEQPQQLNSARKALIRLIDISSKIPFTMWMSEYSIYTWVHVICLLFMLRKKKFQELFCCGVSYFNYLICFAAPISYARYALPMMVCTPFIIIMTFSKKKEDAEHDITTGNLNE